MIGRPVTRKEPHDHLRPSPRHGDRDHPRRLACSSRCRPRPPTPARSRAPSPLVRRADRRAGTPAPPSSSTDGPPRARCPARSSRARAVPSRPPSRTGPTRSARTRRTTASSDSTATSTTTTSGAPTARRGRGQRWRGHAGPPDRAPTDREGRRHRPQRGGPADVRRLGELPPGQQRGRLQHGHRCPGPLRQPGGQPGRTTSSRATTSSRRVPSGYDVDDPQYYYDTYPVTVSPGVATVQDITMRERPRVVFTVLDTDGQATRERAALLQGPRRRRRLGLGAVRTERDGRPGSLPVRRQLRRVQDPVRAPGRLPGHRGAGVLGGRVHVRRRQGAVIRGRAWRGVEATRSGSPPAGRS